MHQTDPEPTFDLHQTRRRLSESGRDFQMSWAFGSRRNSIAINMIPNALKIVVAREYAFRSNLDCFGTKSHCFSSERLPNLLMTD